MRKAPCISPPRLRCKKPLTNPGGVRVVIISLAPSLQQGGIFEMTDKTFDTIPREVIELGSKLTAAELRCVIDMLKANLYGDAAGKCQPKDAEKEI
jgi:hypothetical protein